MFVTLIPYLVAVLAAGGFWVYEKATIAGLRTEVSSLQKQIDDPTTGWRKQLTTCVANGVQYTTTLMMVGDQIKSLAAIQSGVVDEQKKVAAATAVGAKQTADAVHTILSAPPRGPDVCVNALAIQREPLP